MQVTSALYNSIYAIPHRIEPYIEIWSPTFNENFGTIPNSNIIELKTERGLFDTNDFTIGCCFAGEIDAKFFPINEDGEEVTIPRMGAIKVYIELVSLVDSGTIHVGDKSEALQKGVFFIDTRSVEKSSGLLTIHGFDAMLKAESLYTDDGNTTYPLTDYDMVDKIAEAMGIQTDQRTAEVITGEYSIGLPLGYAMREVLSGIAIPYCANFCISDEGRLLAVSAIVPEPENGVLIDNVSGVPITIGGDRIIV